MPLEPVYHNVPPYDICKLLELINEYDSNNKVTFEELESKINISLKEFDEKNKSDKINLLSKIEKMIDELSTKRV